MSVHDNATTMIRANPVLDHPLAKRLRAGDGIYPLLAVVFAIVWLLIFIDGGSLSFKNLLVRSVALAIVAAGQTLVVVAGSIDLSIPQVMTLSAMVAARVMDGSSDRLLLGIVVALVVSLVVGLANGLIVTRLGVNGFIATLGMSLILQGQLASHFAQNAPQSVADSFVDALGFGSLGIMPWSVILMVFVVVVVGLVLRSTRIGAHIYAVGGSPEIARNSGITVGRSLIAAHMICGLTAGIAGIYLAARLGTPNVEIGTNGLYDLESIAVVVLGGAALLGGRGKVGNTMAAVLLFALVDAALNQYQVDPFLKLVLRGVIIIAAVASYTLRQEEEAA